MVDRPGPADARRYLALTAGALLLALAGYLGYALYPRFELPAGAGAGLLLLAAGAGVASFFSPCSFPLLVTMLARPIAEQATAQHPRPLRAALGFASALAVGAVAFLLGIGAVIALAGGGLFANVTFTSTTGRAIRLLVGLGLIALGLIQLERLPVNLRRFEPAMHGYLRRQARLRRQRPTLGFGLFGFGYLLAGFG
ncbi:MAG TPA: cytochrome c biogenesis protein CcdA [Actinomycetota bacterium]|jgi:cytochrome c-type biogenesis protein|nr:cytochrome c biogenesis protein CcdA [Actinomycetota bacterium]